MAEIVTKGQRVLPRRAEALGFAWAHPDLEEALRSALSDT
jgi:NAD dependent epimerase/dehydratase family enzyme